MPKTKISEFSATPGNNTDIDGINISEGCAPSGINDAIRELMAQLKDFQAGTAGDSFNGPVGTTTPAAGAFTNFSASGTFALTGDQVQISEGGTGQTTANAAFNALAPSQTSNAGRYLKTDGTNTSWDLLDISTADITGTLPVANGGTGITSFGTGVATALGINVGSSGAFVTNGGALGTPSSGTVTNLTGTASININGTVGATTPNTGSFTTLTTSSTVTINGGTANGVAYLNGSKVLTTGSALTFDGTNLGVGVTSVGAKIQAETNASSGDTAVVAVSKTGLGYTTTLGYYASAGTATAGVVRSANNLPLAFETNNSEQMRLTSTGLGIGTSSPATKLDVNGDITQRNGSGITIGKIENASGWYSLTGDSANVNGAQMSHSTTLRFVTASTERMRLDSSGNLGLGVTPSAWGSGKAIELGQVTGNALWGLGINSLYLTSNARWNGSNYVYTNNGAANLYGAGTGNGTFTWFTAPSGTAGNAISFTQALTLNANGALVLQGGNTSASGVGVAFPATQSASSDANTLDDYEEGTFTPVIADGITSPTYTVQNGTYTKIGRLVTYSIRLTLSAGTAAANLLQIGGLPFTAASAPRGMAGSISYASGSVINSTSTNLPVFEASAGSSTLNFYKTNGSQFLGTDLATASTFDIDLGGQYFV